MKLTLFTVALMPFLALSPLLSQAGKAPNTNKPPAPAKRICNICYEVASNGDLHNFSDVVVAKSGTYVFVQTVYTSLGAKVGQKVIPKPGMAVEQAATQVTLTPANMTGTSRMPRNIEILGTVVPPAY